MLKFCLRMRYSSKSSGPSKASRKTSSASGGMYRSLGSVNSGSPYSRAIATRSTASGSASAGGGGMSGTRGCGASKAIISSLTSDVRCARYWTLVW